MTASDRFRELDRQPFVSTTANRSLAGAWRSIREIVGHREMLGLLVRRDVRARYKDSALGLVWSLARPITQLLIYYVVVGYFLGARAGIPDFAIYIFAGLTAYSLFSEIVGGATGSIISNAGIVKKIYVPREVFPLASVGSALFSFSMQLVVLLLATLAFGVFPLHLDLLYLIPSLAIILVYGLAFGLLLAAVNVYLRDVQYLVEVILLVLLWASPIVYSWGMVKNVVGEGLLLDIYTSNPVTLAVFGFHEAFWIAGESVADSAPNDLLARQGIAIAIGLVLIVAFQRVFARLQGNFAQEL